MNDEIKIAGVTIPVVELEDFGEAIIQMAGPKSMKRDRSYSGQSHTDNGIRGQTEVKGLTFRDLNDCFVRAILLSAPHLVPKLYDEALKGENAELNGNVLYAFDLDQLDPIPIGQNLSCEVERVMGIFPNAPGPFSEE